MLGRVASDYVTLSHVRPGYVRLDQVMSD